MLQVERNVVRFDKPKLLRNNARRHTAAPRRYQSAQPLARFFGAQIARTDEQMYSDSTHVCLLACVLVCLLACWYALVVGRTYFPQDLSVVGSISTT